METRDKNGMTEAEYLAAYAKKNYPKPALTADIAVFARTAQGLQLLLVRRGGHPQLGCWALPGGFANAGEPLEVTAARELAEETGLQGLPLEEIGVFSAPGRDARGWVVSAAYASCLPNAAAARAGDDAADTAWFTVQLTQAEASGQNGNGRQNADDGQIVNNRQAPDGGQHRHSAQNKDAVAGTQPAKDTPAAQHSAVDDPAGGVLLLRGPQGTVLRVTYTTAIRPTLRGQCTAYTADTDELAFDHGQILLCALQRLGVLRS